jgi:peptidoglycan/xylan/chitin deacetylase (PgdA/CDA1 family)
MEGRQVEGTTPEPRVNSQIIKVLRYHRIVDDVRLCSAQTTYVHTRTFRHQLELMDRWGFTPITFRDYDLFVSGELNLPRKPVILTFDNGYADTYHYAFPLLQEFGAKAVVFVVGDRKIASNTWEHNRGEPPGHLMSGQQIIEMHAEGFEIGSCAMSHPKFSELSSDGAWEEISRSRILLEIMLNAPVCTFSYPYGWVEESIKKMVADAGYTFACSVSTGPARFGSDLLEIRRLSMRSNMRTLGFGVRLLGPYEHYEYLKQVLRSGKKHDGGANDVPREFVI